MEAIGDLTETRFFLVVERKQGVWRGVNRTCELCISRRGLEGKSGKEMEMFPLLPSSPLPAPPLLKSICHKLESVE